MASIRKTKKEVEYLTNEVISNCYMAVYFQGQQSEQAISAVIEKAVELHNTTMDAINHVPEKHNRKLVKKHFASLENSLIEGVDSLFQQISTICKAN